MSFKKPADEKNLYSSGNKIRVKNSYYTFSKQYPIGNIKMSRKASRRKKKNKIVFLTVLAVLCFILITSLAFFMTDTAIKISYKSDDETGKSETIQNAEPSSLLSKGSVKAVYMDYSALSNKKYIRSVIKKIDRKDCNSVMIDFKTRDGHLAYSSKQQLALISKCAVFDNETIRSAIKQFSSAGITVIAGIYCFEDSLVSSVNSDLAVKYLNTDVNWLDDLEENNGRSWLNPYSKEARKYIKEVISEVYNLGARGFVLRSVSFPSGESRDSATFPGERKSSLRGKLLEDFVSSIKKALPSDSFLLVEETATDIVSGNEQLYSGSFANNSADGILADTSVRPEQYFPDKKSGFSSMIGLFSEMNSAKNDEAKLVALINKDDYSRKYLSTLRKSGFDNYILTD